MVNFHNLKCKFGAAIQHRGDNLTGGGGGDDEKIDVFLNLLPPQVTQFFIVVNVYSEGAMFDSVNPAHIRMMDGNDQELLKYFRRHLIMPTSSFLAFFCSHELFKHRFEIIVCRSIV